MHRIIGITILIIGILSPSLSFAQEKENNISSETQAVLERVDSAGEWVSTTLDTLANKLGTTVEYLWPTFVKEAYITGLAMILGGLLALIAWCFMAYFFTELRNRLNKEYGCCGKHGWAEGAAACEILKWILLVISLIICIPLILDGLIHMVAPEPEALRNISEAIGNLK